MSDSEKLGCQNEVVCNLVKSSINQAQKSYQTYVETAEKLLHDTPAADAPLHQKALAFAKHDADANFAFALKLLDVHDLDEVIRLQDEHAKRQTDEMAKRVSELQSYGAGHEDVQPATAVADDPLALAGLEAPGDASDDENEGNAAAAFTSLLATGTIGAGAAAALAEDDDTPTSEDAAEPSAANAETVATGEAGSDAIADELTGYEHAATEETPEATSGDEHPVALEEAPEVEPAAEVIPVPAETASDSSLEAEIEALATKIHHAKLSNASESVSDDAIAAAVREAEAMDNGQETAHEPVAETSALMDAPMTDGAEAVVESKEAAPAAPQDGDELFEAPGVPAEQNEGEEAAGAPITVASVENGEAAAPVTTAEPKSFSNDLAAQLEAVRAMIHGSPAGSTKP